MWDVPLEIQQPEVVTNNILAQKSKPEISNYLFTALFSPTTASLLKARKQVLLKTWPDLIEKLIKRHIENQGTQQWDT